MHAGETLSHHQVGSGGKVPYQRPRGRKLKRQLIEFGEKVMWQPLDTLKQGSLNPRWIEGIWPGVRPQTSEVIVAPAKVFSKHNHSGEFRTMNAGVQMQ